MKRIITILAAIALVSCPAAQAWAQGMLSSLEKEITALVEAIRPSLVTVETSDKGDKGFSWVGTGVIWSADGKVVTTASLISDDDQVTVTLADGSKLPAKVLGIEDQYNLALLKVDRAGLPAIRLGNSDLAKAGSWVTVIGNSYGLASSVNLGLMNGIRDKDSLMQLSAGVAPGNSGGPVLNTNGEMIAMVYGRMSNPLDLGPLRVFGEGEKSKQIAIFSRPLDLPSSETALAIPSNKIRAACEYLEQHGTRKKGFLGVIISDLSDKEKKDLKLSIGLRIEDVVDDSPAEKAGVKDSDLILEFNGKKVAGTKEFRAMVAELGPGTKVGFKIRREGKDKKLTAELTEAPGRSLKMRTKKLVIPDIDIDLPDIDLKGIEGLGRSDMDKIRQEMLEVKEELRRLREEMKAGKEKIKIQKRVVEQEGGQ
jgi:serine protease Do